MKKVKTHDGFNIAGETENIEINRITVLTGMNSIGKSSMLHDIYFLPALYIGPDRFSEFDQFIDAFDKTPYALKSRELTCSLLADSIHDIFNVDTKSVFRNDEWTVNIDGIDIQSASLGITYVIPILLYGLSMSSGKLIIENPEAFLHPKAQSNMGYFIAQIASRGVNVVIKTHSEHIINGIRRMLIEGKTNMSYKDLTIYFLFKSVSNDKNITKIIMDNMGNLSEFPVDFFDQVRQDTYALLKMTRTNE